MFGKVGKPSRRTTRKRTVRSPPGLSASPATSWMPLGELVLERHRRRILDDIGFGRFTVPAADFYETDHDFVIELEVPGFEEKELGIEVSEHRLTIEGERKTETEEEPEKAFRFRGRLEKTFERRFYPSAGSRHGPGGGDLRERCAQSAHPEGPRGEAIGT